MRRSVMTWLFGALGFAVACGTTDTVVTGTRSDGVTVICNTGEYYYVCTPDSNDSSTIDPSASGGDSGGSGEQNCNPDTYPCPDGGSGSDGSGSTDGSGSDGSGSTDGSGSDGSGSTDGSGSGDGSGSTDGSGSDGGSGDGSGQQCGPDTFPCTDDGSGGDGGEACTDPWPSGTATVLWPPNHKLHTYTLADCGKVDVCPNGQAIASGTITKITVDEEIEVGRGGDGHTTNYDARIIDTTHFELRSERQGGMDGRVYTVYYVDANNVEGTCQFLVPHSQSPFQGAVDSGTIVEILPP